MAKQSYKNHLKFYVPHHFILLPLLGFMMVWGIVNAYKEENRRTEWLLFTLLSFCILYLAIMVRQHYALGNQDRIVRLEFRLRYFELYGKSASSIQEKLSFGQIAAIRFADDIQFKELLALAIKDNLKTDDIKKRITHWQADTMRL